MTKKDLVNGVAVFTEQPTRVVELIVDEVLLKIKEYCKDGKEIEIRGFGAFRIVHRKAKKARNIEAGTEIIIPAHKEVKFVPSKFFKL